MNFDYYLKCNFNLCYTDANKEICIRVRVEKIKQKFFCGNSLLSPWRMSFRITTTLIIVTAFKRPFIPIINWFQTFI